MAQREASVKLTLDDAEYVADTRKAGDEAEKAGKKGEKGMRLFGAGIKGVKSQLGGLKDTVGKALGLVTGLAAGFSVGSAIKGAVELDTKFKQLAFRMSRATGAMVNHVEVQRTVERAAAKTGQRTADMATAFDDLFKATGDAAFAEGAIEDIGTMATATGTDLGTLTTLADQLHTKFGVTNAELKDTFAQVFDASTKGGPAFGEFADVMSTVGAELIQAGMGGKQGLDFMLGALVKTDDEFGNLGKQVKGIKQILLSLGDTKQIEGIAKSMQIDPKTLLKEKDLMGRMKKILSFGQKGLAAIKGSMHDAEEQKTLRILFTDPFEAALKEADASGKKGKAAIDSALVTLDDGIKAFGKSTLTGARVQEEAADRMKDPEARLSQAMEALERSFAQPQLIEALEELAQNLPAFAQMIGKLVKFSAGNPLLAGGLFLGGQAGLGFAKGAAGNLLTSKAAPLLEKAGGASLMGKKVGNLAGGLGAVGAIATAGLIGKEAIDFMFEGQAATTSDLSAAGAAAGGTRGSLKSQKAQADRLRASIASAESEQGGFGGFMQSAFGKVAGLVSGDSNLNLHEQRQKQLEEMKAVLAAKDARIAAMTAGGGAGGAPAGTPAAPSTVQVDAKSQREAGKATADALAAGKPIRVLVQNPTPGAAAPSSGASRGPSQPRAPQAGGGV